MQISHQTLLFPIIQSDITNTCNLRCKFCLTDFSNPPPKENMTKQVFQKSLQTLPLAADNAFHFSCSYEPMINPDFLELLALFPKESRSKALFTTNLAKQLSDEDVLQMAKANVNRINISLETFNPELYTHIVGVKKSYILENLEKIARIFPTVENAPRLCFITMVLKDNYDEIFSIAQKVSERYSPMHHSFRTPYNFNVKNEYNEANLLPREKLDRLKEQLEAAFPHAVIEFGSDEASYFNTVTNDNTNYFNFNEHYLVTVNPNGTGEFRADHSAFDLNQMEDIPAFFAEKRTQLQELQCKRTPPAELPAATPQKNPDMRLSQVVLYNERFLLLNASLPKEAAAGAEVYWDILINKQRYCRHTSRIQSADPASCIVESLIDLRELGVHAISSLKVSVVIVQGGEARSYVLLKGLARFVPLRRVLGKVRRRLGL